MNEKPANCRNRLRDEGKMYPRSGCAHCKTGGLLGCPFERPTPPASHDSAGAEGAVAWYKPAGTIRDGNGIDIGVDEPDIAWQKERPGTNWLPLYDHIAGGGYLDPCDELDALRAQLAEANARYDEYVIAIGGKYSEATRLIIDLREDLRLWVHRHDEACSQLASMTAARDLWLQRHGDLTIGLAASEARVGRLHNIAARFGGLLWDRYDVCPECGCTKDTHLASCTEAYTRLFKRPTDCAVAFDGAYPALSQSNGGEVGG